MKGRKGWCFFRTQLCIVTTQATYTLQGWLPTETWTSFFEPVARLLPEMVSLVPPACGPLSGVIWEGRGSCKDKMVKLSEKINIKFIPVLLSLIGNIILILLPEKE